MSNYASIFNKTASRTKGVLSHAFATAALSKPGQAFIRNAGRITGLSFLGGDLLLGFQYASIAAVLVAADGFLAVSDFQNRKPEQILPNLPIGSVTRNIFSAVAPHGVRIAGLCSLWAAGALAYFTKDQPGSGAMMASCSLIALQAGSMIFEKQFHHLADKFSHSKSKVVSSICRYPILSATCGDLAGKGIMAYGAIQSGDMKLLSATFLWAVGGDGGMICKDENVVRWIDKKKAERSMPAPMAA